MENKNKKRVKNIISTIVSIIILVIAFSVFSNYDFNYYTKGITETGKTSFTRDSKTTNDDNGKSYKIENKEYNDAMFYKKIEVKENKPYRVTCMIKTENVEQEDNNALSGAQIILKGTEEHSKVISQTNDWTKVEFCFNSKNNTEVEIGFRLGGNGIKAKGTAWFDDIKLEIASEINDSNWNFLCCIVDTIDVNIDGKKVTENLSSLDKTEIKSCMSKFQTTATNLSKGKMQVTYDIVETTTPVTTLSYDEDSKYYISEKDVYNQIESQYETKEYDHVFVCFRLPDEYVGNWVGLGNMEYLGRGFSNIRITEGTYKYSGTNTFPEEVFLHEFLHTLERNSEEYGYERPNLHDYEQYGYSVSRTDGLRQWYKDYMNKEISYNNSYIGLPSEIFSLTPVQDSDFKYSTELSDLEEPQNIIQEIRAIGHQIINLFKNKTITTETKGVAE